MKTFQWKPMPSRPVEAQPFARMDRSATSFTFATLLLFGIGFVEAGCYPKVAAPPAAVSADSATKASTRWPGVTPAALSHGHDLFLAKCNGCHGYPDLAAIPDERWPGIVEKMAKKSDLGPEDGDAVLHYVLTSRSEQTGH
jgi:hypothetical protein